MDNKHNLKAGKKSQISYGNVLLKKPASYSRQEQECWISRMITEEWRGRGAGGTKATFLGPEGKLFRILIICISQLKVLSLTYTTSDTLVLYIYFLKRYCSLKIWCQPTPPWGRLHMNGAGWLRDTSKWMNYLKINFSPVIMKIQIFAYNINFYKNFSSCLPSIPDDFC